MSGGEGSAAVLGNINVHERQQIAAITFSAFSFTGEFCVAVRAEQLETRRLERRAKNKHLLKKYNVTTI